MQSVHTHCVSLYIYLSIHLSIYISDMYVYNKTVLFSDWTVETLAKTKCTLFWKWCHFMVNLYFNWDFFVTSKVYKNITFRVSIDEDLEKTERYSILKTMSFYGPNYGGHIAIFDLILVSIPPAW